MKRGIGLVLGISLVGTLFFFQALPVTAATVGVSYYGLSPNPVEIKVGEAVYWTDADPDFAPYIISGVWGYFYTPGGIQFNAQGTYNYSAESAWGGGSWGGTVHVSPNSPPQVTITNPTNGSVFIAPATFSFEADAYDANPGDLWDVEFWVGNQMVDDVYYAPYATTVTNLPAGTYILKAIVWDYSYTKATNTITITVFNAGPVTLTASALVSGKFEFHASGFVVGKTYVLQSSTNLAAQSSWTAISTNVADSSTASFTNAVTAGQRLFRILELP